MNIQTKKILDIKNVVILGSGPAGLTAAIYAARAGLKPLVLEGAEPGGQLMGTTYVENWPGEQQILGPKLMANMRNHALHFGADIQQLVVQKVDLSDKPFKIITQKNISIFTHSLIIATGATPKRLNCPGEDTYWARGVSTCAVCDGAFYKNKKVIIVGGGDSAMESASFLTKFTQDITIIHILDKLTASASMQQRVLKNKHIKIIYQSTISKITGNKEHVTAVEVTNQETGKITELPADGVFINIGLTPNTTFLGNQLALDKYGYIVLTNHTNTSVPGVFAAGDVADSRYRQAITAAGTGCAASLDMERYLQEHI